MKTNAWVRRLSIFLVIAMFVALAPAMTVSVSADPAPTIGGKSVWKFGDTIEFGDGTFYYIYNTGGDVNDAHGNGTLQYQKWSVIYKQHIAYFSVSPTDYMLYFQPEDYEAETPKTPAGLKLIGGNGTEGNPYSFALWYEYTVKITPGENMTKTSGEESQTVNEGVAMTDVVYTASSGCFPETYTVGEVNGVTVTRVDANTVKVSGTPTWDAAITLAPPSAHTPSATDAIENENAPTCEGAGSYDAVSYCDVCGAELGRDTIPVDPLGHNWNAPSYSWETDNGSVTGTRICKRDASHIDTETVSTTSEITKAATVTEMGEHTYTATFTKTGFTTQTKTVADIPTLSTITFNANGGTVTPANAQTDMDGKLASLPTPTRSGYNFNGWFTAESGDTTITTETVFDADTEIFAQWTKRRTAAATYTVTPAIVENGAVTTSPKNASKGSIVTITVTPDDGYKLDRLTVADQNGKSVAVTEKNGVYTFTMPASNISVTPVFVKADNENSFTDIAKGDYFYDAVLWAAKGNITSGTTATTFSPNVPCTRGQTVTFLWRAAGSPEPNTANNPFTDVKEGDYFYKAVLWAYKNGITKGASDTEFSPNNTVTRGQTVTFLYRWKGGTANGANPFTDVKAGDYFHDAVLWANENDITNGTTANTFSPDAPCLRGQIVTFLYRCYQ